MMWLAVVGVVLTLCSLGVNIMQLVRSIINRLVLRGVKIQVNQLLAHCNDAQQQELIGLNKRETDFVVSIGHDLRSIERQLDDMIGPTAVREIETGKDSRWRRFWRWL